MHQVGDLNILAIFIIDGSFPKDHAWSPVITQVAHTSVEIALAKYFETLGIKPQVVAGHSLGEYAAFVIAGVLSSSDAIFLVGSRAQMLQSLCPAGTHRMMAVKASKSDMADTVKELPYDLACVNGPKENVLCGTTEQMEAVSVPLKEKGYRVMFLDVPFAFHSTQTDLILDLFEETARKSVIFCPPMLPIVSPLLGKVVFDGKSLNAEYLRRATRGTVDFLSAMQNAQETSTVDKNTVWVEVGPHPVCVAFVKASFNPAPLTVGSFRRGEDNWTSLAQSLGQLHTAGVQVQWSEFHRPFEKSLRLLDLPTGDWALTKGNTFYDAEKGINRQSATAPVSGLKTTTVQQIIVEKFEGATGKVVMQSDLMQPDLLVAAHGHKMNDCGVITSSIHGDIVYTLGKYLYKNLIPSAKTVDMNITELVVTKGLVAQRNTKTPQYFRVTATTADINIAADLMWQNVTNDGTLPEPFATCRVIYGSAGTWLSSWSPLAYLVQGRIETLERLAAEGIANRLSHKMAYTLFSSSLVDHADKYRGMQAVVMNEFEAFADVTLKDVQGGGDYEVPPYFIDSVIHLAGFIMNVSDASDTANTFCVTSGWDSMRFARPLVAGQKYRSYVKMIPTENDPSVYLGDVYVIQDGVIMGMVGGMQFRRYPRILMNRFFAAPGSSVAMSYAAASSFTPAVPAPAPAPAVSQAKPTVPGIADSLAPCPASAPAPAPSPIHAPAPAAPPAVDSDNTSGKALVLIAKEGGLDLSDLVDDAAFANLGVDSLMSLVIAEKFREELGIVVAGSFFLEYPIVGALRSWLEEYYS
ncbi:hypothetical protein N7501_000107 [Penicillium viridicatum]|nr:hypothetical protein N7501_000107 [Penicillium viridicatum]